MRKERCTSVDASCKLIFAKRTNETERNETVSSRHRRQVQNCRDRERELWRLVDCATRLTTQNRHRRASNKIYNFVKPSIHNKITTTTIQYANLMAATTNIKIDKERDHLKCGRCAPRPGCVSLSSSSPIQYSHIVSLFF